MHAGENRVIGGAPELVGPYHYTAMRRFLQRVGFLMALAAIALLCLSSVTLAAIVGVSTAAVVALDMFVLAPAKRRAPIANDVTPEKLSVDLSRRQ